MKLFHAPSLVQLTTLRVGGRAIALIMPETREDIERIPELAKKLGGSPFMLGRGSNLLAPDGEIPLILIRPLPYSKPVILHEDDISATISIDASMPLPRLIAWTSAHGFSGLEHLTGIPGEVGGAIRMNAGSYGVSFCDYVMETEIFSFETGFHSVPSDEMKPTYRRTLFPKHDNTPFLILSAVIRLMRADIQSIRAESRAIMTRKASTQPMKAWSAGCAFTNPEGHSVGKLLDELGFKGIKLGGMAFSPMHANFLINTGEGTASQALELLHTAHEAIETVFNINLNLEIRILPCFSPNTILVHNKTEYEIFYNEATNSYTLGTLL